MNKSRLARIGYPLPWDPAQQGRKLAPIAYAKAEGISTMIKGLEMLPYIPVIFYDPCPSFCGIETFA